MTEAEKKQAGLPSFHVTLAAGLFGGFCLLALVDACAIALLVPLSSGGVPLRLADLLFDAAETVGLGALTAVVAGLVSRALQVATWMRWAVFALATVVLIHIVVGEYLELQAAHALGGRLAPVVLANYYLVIAGALGIAPYAGAYAATRPRLRASALVVALGALVVDQLFLRDDYLGIHGFIALGAVLLASGAVAPLVVRAGRALRARPVGRGALIGLALFALFGLAYPPPDAVRCELFRQPVGLAPWFLATMVWRAPPLHAPVALAPSPWREDRSKQPPIPPTTPPALPANPVVVLLTIDAVRGDLIADPANDARFPTLTRMKREGVYFAHASSAATQTPLSIGTLFSGVMYSEQRWEDYGVGEDRFPYPAADTYPRVPELMTAHGVSTVLELTFPFLAGSFGLTRGFDEERTFGKGHFTASADVMVTAILERLGRAGGSPLFIACHFAEPHAPYFRGKGRTDYERYLSAISESDRQVARVLAFLEEHMGRRWALFVSSDHGEAFGDHGTFEHGKSLYEELVHVPLLAMSPAFKAHRVDTRVGLVDVASTLLDLFGIDTPATFDGQSLVPLLEGRQVAFTRPLLAEGRLKTALTTEDGFKVIDDPRRKTVEAYDLVADPGETRNLFDAEPGRVDPALAELRAFFAARTRHEKGYWPPYKP